MAQEAYSSFWSTRLHLKISEAKELQAKDLSGTSDPYCIIKVDGEPVARTSTIWKTLNPFFGEEFVLDLANNFQRVTIELYDQDKIGKDDGLGFFDFFRQDLMDPSQSEISDKWYPVISFTNQTKVQGEVFVETLITQTDTGLERLTVTVVKARDFTSKETANAKCDPFFIVQVDSEQQQGEKCKSSRYPFWDATFTFERDRLGPDVHVIMRDAGILKGSTFLGEAVISLEGLVRGVPKRDWYPLRPRAKDLDTAMFGHGSLRLSVKFAHELILPLPCYEGIIGFMVASVQSGESDTVGGLAVVDELLFDREYQLSDRDALARALVNILHARHEAVNLIAILNSKEISKATSSSTLFRGNSLASKCTDQFMKLVGLRYLHEVLKPVIDDIFREDKDTEIDPSKVVAKSGKVDEIIKKRTAELCVYLRRILEAIFVSVDDCPVEMRVVFNRLQQNVRENAQLKDEDGPQNVTYTVVSGFLFLRFFAPAVLSPKLFGMREELANARTARTLTLLAKTMQTIGNLGSTMSSGKEAYMEPLYPVIEENLDKVRRYIDRVCAVDGIYRPPRGPDASDEDAVLISGAVSCRIDEAQKAGGSFKKFQVTLTKTHLRWEKPKDSSSKQVIPMSHPDCIERMDLGVFDKKHTLVVKTKSRVMYLTFTSMLESDAWLQALRKAARASHARTKAAFHPGIYKKDMWTCCKYKSFDQVPCSRAHASVNVDQFFDVSTVEEWSHKLFVMLQQLKPVMDKRYLGDNPEYNNRPHAEGCRNLLYILDEIQIAQLLHQQGGSS